MKTRIKKTDKIIVVVWGPGSWTITEKRGFKTLAGAKRFAEAEGARSGMKRIDVRTNDNVDEAETLGYIMYGKWIQEVGA